MQTLSLAMIVKNEELTLERVLRAAATFCDELIVVDTGSTDRTVEIAESLGAKIYHFEWIQDFATARNFSFSKCTCDWVIWLDADDWLDLASRQIIRDYKESMLETTDKNAIMCPYDYGRTMLIRERIIRRSANLKWVAPVHEVIPIPSDICLVIKDIVIRHDTHPDNLPRKKGRNVQILKDWFHRTDDLRLLYLLGSELADNEDLEAARHILELYIHRKGSDNSSGELYWTMVKLCDVFRKLQRYPEAISWGHKLIALDSARAEGFTLIGLCYASMDKIVQATPYFAAALSLEPPEVLCGVLTDFYDYAPRTMLMKCLENLGTTDRVAKKLTLL